MLRPNATAESTKVNGSNTLTANSNVACRQAYAYILLEQLDQGIQYVRSRTLAHFDHVVQR
jgi:hypothetical protein